MTYTTAKRYPDRTPRRLAFACHLLVACSLLRPAAAVQPLQTFLTAATTHNYSARQSEQVALQRSHESQASTGKLLPSITLGGTYTRNEYAAVLPVAGRVLRLAPYDQLDASATLTVPVFDVTSWARRTAARAQSSSASAQWAAGQLGAARQVAQQYYALRGNEGVLASAKNSLNFTQRNLALVQQRKEVGTASALDVARAESDEAQATQQVAAAELQVVLSRRSLETLTGLEAEAGEGLDEVDLFDEAPLSQWMAAVGPSLPTVADATAQQRMARAGDQAAKFGYMPTLSVSATERITNASALNGGHTFVWQAKANLTWTLDATLTPTQKAQAHVARAARVKSEQVLRDAADAVFNDWAQIRSNQATSRAARAQVKATKLAEALALEKVAAGVVTQLDVTQARRDAFAAEVSRIQADANLMFYRTLLRLDSASSIAAFEEPKP